MIQEITKQDWKQFFDDLTKRRFEWQTKVEVFSKGFGHQILDEGLLLVGITAERRGDKTVIEVIVGEDADHHQEHNIENPLKINYESEEGESGGIVDIEEENGTKTLIHIIKAMPLEIEYRKTEGIVAA